MHRRDLLGASAAMLLPSAARAADAFPSHALRYIVPVSAGGGSDFIARVVTERWGKALGQGFVVENQGGGGGVIACQATMRSAPDGYTLMQGYVATHGTTPRDAQGRPTTPSRTSRPIGMIGATPNVLVIDSQRCRSRTLAEFVAYLKSHQGKVSLWLGRPRHADPPHDGTASSSSSWARFDGPRALSRHRARASPTLMGGQTQAIFPGLAAALQHIRSGRDTPAGRDGQRARSQQHQGRCPRSTNLAS